MTAADRRLSLSLQILHCCRNELYSLFPQLDGAFASLPPRAGDRTASMGTDGVTLAYSAEYVTDLFSRSPAMLRRGCLHILLHCLYLHPFRRGRRREALWDLACDMAVEQILRREARPRLEVPRDPVREACCAVLGDTPLAAEAICDLLEAGAFPFRMEEMAAAFLFDDHSLWAQAPGSAGKRWQQVLAYTAVQQENRRRGTRTDGRKEQAGALEKSPRDYRTYLRRFALPREEMELDMDSFDYIYYHLGLEQYGDLPLIEPLEYREGYKLEQLVIAIDTSGSCSRETVRRFLSETYGILSARENFFRKMEVWLIQCDCVVQSVAVIHSEQEWKNYSRDITIQGRGGTDFTPVFRYVQQRQEQGRLRQLRALLYFTDGDGCYPRVRPPYETAFVFFGRTEFMEAAPPWATQLLAEEQI